MTLEVRHFLRVKNLTGGGEKRLYATSILAFFALNIVLNTGAPVAGLMHCWLMIKLKEQKEIGRKVREEE